MGPSAGVGGSGGSVSVPVPVPRAAVPFAGQSCEGEALGLCPEGIPFCS